MTDDNSQTSDNDKSELPSSNLGLLWFLITSLLYFGYKYKNISRSNVKTSNTIFIIYILAVVIGEYTINLKAANSSCSSSNFTTALISTFVPWVLIFGLLNVILMIFPGWLTPFSNTIGYLIVKLMGLEKLISEIFKPSDYYKNVNKSKDLIPLQEALGHIYSDKALLINEVTPDNLNDFWKNMAPLIRDTAKSNEELKDKFYKLLRLKELVSEFMWYILTGALVTSISYNYITNRPCSISADAMKELHDKHQEEEMDKHLDNNDNERKIYSTRE